MREISPSVPNARLGPTRPTRALAERAQPPEENTQRGLDSLQLTPTKEAPPLQSPPTAGSTPPSPVAAEEKSSDQASKADLLGFGLTHQTSDGTLLDATGGFALGPGNLAITGQGSQARVGNTVLHSDGSQQTRVGDTLFHSDGKVEMRFGDTLVDSDGGVTTKFGNTILSSDGTSSTLVGNTVFRSDGTSSTQFGNTILNSDGSSSTRIGNTIIHSDGRITFVT